MIERIKTFLAGRGYIAGQGIAGAATVHVCMHPCPEHLAIAGFFWAVGIVCAIRNGS